MDTFRVSAPTRADLAGGTLDIWPIYDFLEGARTINVALDLQASATFQVLPAVAFRMEIRASNDEMFVFEEPLGLEACRKLVPALQFPVMVASSYLRQQPYLPEKFIRVVLEAQAPLRSGLGGSSTLCVALVRGLSRIFQQYTEQGWQWEMLHWVKDVEAAFLRTTTGVQDYLAAMFGGCRTYHFDIGKMETHLHGERVFQELSQRLLVLYSGEMHSSGLSNWELYKAILEGKREVTQGFVSIRKISEALDREMRNPQPNWSLVGQILNEEWEVRRSIFKVETKRLDEIISFLTANRVLGRKVCGAAQGGSIIALVDPARKMEVARACEAAGIQVLKTAPTLSGVTIVEAGGPLWNKA